MDSKTKNSLARIGWDFSKDFPGLSRSVHWYPGTFPSALPAALIDLLTKPNDVVFDPFCGVGTTGSEALRLGRRVWINDVNPIAQAIGYSTLSLSLLRGTSEELFQVVINQLRIELELVGQTDNLFTFCSLGDNSRYMEQINALFVGSCSPNPTKMLSTLQIGEPRWASLSDWFSEAVLAEIGKYYHRIETNYSRYPWLKLLALVLLSSSMRPLSSQNKSWGHIADKVLPKEKHDKNVSALLNRAIGRFLNIPPARIQTSDTGVFSVTGWNWNDGLIPECAFDRSQLLVTSPPYPGAIDYVLSQRLSLYLFGYDDTQLNSLVQMESGARRKRWGSTSNQRWVDEMRTAVGHQTNYVNRDGYVCFVIPHKDYRERNGFETIETELTKRGWSLIFSKDRAIRQERTRQSWTSIKKETIAIFQRG